MALYDDELRKAQAWRAQINAQQQAAQAQEDYERRMRESAERSQAAQNKITNPLEAVLSGIGNGIKNVGDTLYNMAGTGIASIRDIGDSIFGGQGVTTKNQDDWKEYAKKTIYNDENLSDKDYYAKTGGKALDAAATVSDLIPGLGKAGRVALNVGQGITSGVAQQYIDNGANVSLEDALRGGLVGGASAGVGQAIGGKLAGKTAGPNASILSRALNSNIGKGAITGALSGATGAGLNTALAGGDLGDVLGAAAQGAQGGAIGGATTSGVMGLAGKAAEKLNNKVLGKSNAKATDLTNNLTQAPVDETGETATGWGDKNMTGAAKKRNALQKLGDRLTDVGQKTQDQSVTGKLKGNLADEVTAKDSIQRLRNIGFEPSDYEQAANLSEVANKWYDDQVKNSKVTLDMPDTYKLADDAAYYRNLDADQAAKLKMDITKRLDAVRKVGGGLATFDAAGLEKVAKGLGQDAERMTTTNYGGSKKRINNLKADTEAYANALNDIKAQLRSKVDDMTDYNADSLRKVLKDAGATDKQIDYLTDAKSMAAVKRNTSLLEDARNMQRQIKSSPLKRGANADNSTSFVTQAANASGASGLVNMAAEPVGKTVGKIEKRLGKTITSLGDMAAGDGNGIVAKTANKVTNAAGNIADALNNDTIASRAFGGSDLGLPTVGDVMTSQIARQAGLSQGRNMDALRELRQAQTDANNAQTDYQTQINEAEQAYNQAQQMANTNNDMLTRISSAMDQALAVGDISAWNELSKLYKEAQSIYGTTTDNSPYSNLSAAQIENINKMDTAENAINQLDQLFTQAGGGKGVLGGNAANFMASLGLNNDVATYNALARGLINQISAATGKTDTLNTEGEVRRALELIPQFTDTQEVAQAKLESLRQMLAGNRQAALNNYGVAQAQ